MRKALIAVLAACTAIGASALTSPRHHHSRPLNPVTHRMPSRMMGDAMAPRTLAQSYLQVLPTTRDDEQLSMNWGYCNDISMAAPMDAGVMKGAIILTEDLATQFAGATISSISVGNPVDLTTQRPNYELQIYEFDNPIADVTVWLSEGLDKEPFLSVDGKLSSEGFKWSTIDLPEAYTVEAGKQLVIGFTFEVPENKGEIFPLVTDFSQEVNENSCMVYTNLSGYDKDWPIFSGERSWQNLGGEWGNIAIRAMLNGDMLPVDKAQTVTWQGPSYAAPGEDFEFLTIIRNLGANDITQVEYTIEIDGMEAQTAVGEVVPAIPYFEYSDVVTVKFKSETVGNNIGYVCRLTGVNGHKLAEPGERMEGMFLCIEEGYPRNYVFEEATGTWCGWCVVGYAGMEYMAEHYADKGFIGIAVHGDDQMDVMTQGRAYEAFGTYVKSFPSSYVNRNMGASIYPSPVYLEEAFESLKDIPAYVQISASLNSTENPSILRLSTLTEFSDSEEDVSYMIGYTVIEDEVGPYVQTNSTSGQEGDYYGFENMPSRVFLMYNDVARNCSHPMGIEESLPSTVEKGILYDFDTEIELTDVINIDKVRVVVMVINSNNGSIENAVCLESPAYAGVQKTMTESAVPDFVYGTKGGLNFRVNPDKANVYTIAGHRVAAGVKGQTLRLPAGIYLVELNGKIVKTVVK